MELFHATPHGDWSGWLIVAIPSAEPRDHPCGPGEAEFRVRISLPLRVSLQCRNPHPKLSLARGACGRISVVVFAALACFPALSKSPPDTHPRLGRMGADFGCGFRCLCVFPCNVSEI